MGGVAKHKRCVGGEIDQGGRVGYGRLSHQFAQTSYYRFQATRGGIKGFVNRDACRRLEDVVIPT